MPHDHAPPSTTNPVLVEMVRGDLVESRHRGAVAVVDVSGHVQASWGDVNGLVYPRSAVKPLQALALIESGGADALGVTDAELALASASHAGKPMHADPVAAWLERMAVASEALICDPESPLTDPCSGKHAGMLALALHMAAPLKDYWKPQHPVQQRILGVLEQMTGAEPGAAVPCAVDGCSVPTWAWSLGNLAFAWANLAAPDALPPARAEAARRVTAAMAAHPDMVHGPGTFDTEVLRVFDGRVIVKRGAEGVHCAGLPDYGLGVAVKIDDGAGRASERVLAALLHRIGVVEECGIDLPVTVPLQSRAGLAAGQMRVVGGLEALAGLGKPP